METILQRFRSVILVALLLTVSGMTKAFAGDRGPNDFITFADANVKALCVANWDTNGDGELSYAEAEAVTSLGQVFNDNNTITSFDELQYFTGLTVIGEKAFYYCRNLTSVIIPNTVTYIGSQAFYACNKLTSANLPSSVLTINQYAFGFCYALQSVTIPAATTYIHYDAYYYCYGLTQISVDENNTVYDSRNNSNAIIDTETNTLMVGCMNTVIPNTIINIGRDAFYHCTGLISIEIPNSVVSIGTEAFSSCNNLSSISIPNSVQTIGNSAFYSCNALESLFIPASVTSIGQSVIGSCRNITQISVDEGNAVYDSRDNCNAIIETNSNELIAGCKSTIIPNTITSIGYMAFYNCEGITEITIPNSVTKLDDYSFAFCNHITTIELPSSITIIDPYAFYYCTGLTSITSLAQNPPALGNSAFMNVNKSIPVYIPYRSLDAYQNATGWNEFTNFIENMDLLIEFADANVKALCVANWDTNGDGELSYAEAAAVTDLGQVFKNNSTITSFDELQYFTGLTAIGERAFYNCSSLTSVIVPNSVTILDQYAFAYCYYLTSVELSNSLTTIGQYAFDYCYQLASINFPSTVASIGNSAFYYCYSLISLEIPASVMSIGNNAFFECTGLEQITVAESNDIFDSRGNCNAIIETATNTLRFGCKSSTIPNTVTALGDNAFRYMDILSVNIPESVVTIGTNVFGGCQSLEQITVSEGNSVFDSRDNCNATVETGTNKLVFGCKNTIIPNTVTTIGQYAFFNCDSLTSIVIPNSVTAIDQYAFAYCYHLTSAELSNFLTTIGQYAFYYCYRLASINFPSTVASIGNSAFYYCYSLVSLEIPASVMSIGSYAFYSCTGLTSITSSAQNPPTLGNNAFKNVDKSIPVYVPAGTVEAYQAASGWSEFTNIQVNPLDFPIEFADANVKDLCVANWDTNGDGELSYNEAAAVTDLGTVFKNKSTITSFDELQYFTGLTAIGSYAFNGCYNLTTVGLPNSLTTIGYASFENCSQLVDITIPNAVTTIGGYAFNNCGFISLTIPASVTSIGNYAFRYCTRLEQITVLEDNAVFDSRSNCNAIIETSTNTLRFGCKNSSIPNTVTVLADGAFRGMKIMSINIPESVLTIGSNVFGGCNLLEQITVAESNPVYDSRNNCNAIVETGTNKLVAGCKNTVIPNDITIIGDYAFYNQFALTSIVIPNSVTAINQYAFNACYYLTTVELPNSLTTIGYASFENCSQLVDITIPNAVTTIGGYAFNNCGFISLTIPASVASIGNYAFRYCTGLTSIISMADNPPMLGNNVFHNVTPTIPVYVPCNSTDAYTTANWGGFSNILGLCSGEISASVYPEGSGTVTGTGSYEGGAICTLTAIANGEHIQFLNWTKDGEEVSTDETFSFLVTGDAAYVANFEQSEIVGGGGTATNEFLPTFSYYCYSLTQQIYTSDEIGGAQTIDSIAFYNGGATKTRTLDIYMVTTDKTVFDSPNDWIPVTESDLVFSGTVTMEANRWTVFHFNNAFAYDGASNLALITDDNTGDYTGAPHMACRVYDADGNQAIRIYSDNTNYDANNPASYYGTRLSVKNQIKIYSNITFADANVKAICVENWDTNGDGELNFAEAAAVTDLEHVFTRNYNIKSFNELQYFTGLTAIGYQAFAWCNSLRSIVIPNTVTIIDNHAFFDCWSLSAITIPASVTSISTNEAFAHCGLSQIVVEEGNTVYDSRENCNAIIETSTNKIIVGCKNTTFPSTVTAIAGWAFKGSNLTSVSIPNNIVSIPSNPFTSCENINEITVESGNLYYDSRDNCNAIIETSTNKLISGCKNTIIPKTVTTIGNHAFGWCTTLTSISIPGSVTAIEAGGFFDCWSLHTITVLAVNPPTVGYNAFGYVPKSIPVYVPVGTIPAYQAAPGWNEFTNYQEIEIGVTQTTDLEEGWNWFSTFIAIDDPEEGLVMIEEALGEYGLQIKYLDDFTDFDGEEWFGGLEEATNDLMYMIQVNEGCTITLQGLPVNTEEVEITLEPGWNWIGFPSSEVLSIEDAFAGFEPAEGDQIKSIDDYTDFDGEEWFGDLEELTPGVGFMYLNTSDETKTLVFQTDKK